MNITDNSSKSSVVRVVRTLLFAFVAVSLILSLASCGENTESEGGANRNAAPDFTVYDRGGNEVHLSDFVGEAVVLNFWATWCVYCREEMPDFNRAYIEYPGVKFLMVNATDGVEETEDTAKSYVDRMGYGFDIYFDTSSSAQSAYRVNSYPVTYFINANGDLVSRHRGRITYTALTEGIKSISLQ